MANGQPAHQQAVLLGLPAFQSRKAALKHQSTPGHLRATVSLKMFGDTRIDLQLSEQQQRETIAHNEKVRQILLMFGHDQLL